MDLGTHRPSIGRYLRDMMFRFVQAYRARNSKIPAIFLNQLPPRTVKA